MYKIFIDSSDRYEKKVQLKKDKEIVAEKVGDLDIVVALRDILVENNLEISDVEIVDVNKGPGSFTGLKIGITVANTLNWVLGKKDVKDLDLPKYGSEPNIHKTKWLEK
jgi:tRNA A37 threonylcarbamoyladenosine modification protein TsaB